MSTLPLWAQALNIPEEKWNEWTAIHPDPEAILYWCLTNEQISWSKYSEWAKAHFQICYLDDSYFQLEDIIGEETKELLNLAAWSASTQPLYAWDDVIYVACVSPKNIEIKSKKVIPILCSPWQLATRWESIQSFLEKTNPQIQMPDLPDGIIMSSTPPKLNVEPSPKLNADPSPELTITKGGASIHLTKFNFEAPPAPASGTTETNEFGPISLHDAPQDINPDMKEREIVSWLFNQLQPYFEMMWWIDIQDEKAVVKWWHPGNKFDPSQLKVDTHTPSFFRIVKKTKLPYHGHIIDSVTHQTFFAAFGDGSLPAHVTAMPIILQSQFKEIFVGCSNQKQQDPQLLTTTERFLEKALQTLESQRKPKQKTAG